MSFGIQLGLRVLRLLAYLARKYTALLLFRPHVLHPICKRPVSISLCSIGPHLPRQLQPTNLHLFFALYQLRKSIPRTVVSSMTLGPLPKPRLVAWSLRLPLISSV
jgi:hypothetical protein